MSRFSREEVHELLPLILDFFTINDYIFWSQVSKTIVNLTEDMAKYSKIFQLYSILQQIRIEAKMPRKGSGNRYHYIFNELDDTVNEKKSTKSINQKKRYFIALLRNYIITQNLIIYADMSLIKIILTHMEKHLPKPKKQIVLEDIVFFSTQRGVQIGTIQGVAIRCPELLQDSKTTGFSLDEICKMEKNHQTGTMLLEAYSQSENFRNHFFDRSKEEILTMDQQQLSTWISEHPVERCVFF